MKTAPRLLGPIFALLAATAAAQPTFEDPKRYRPTAAELGEIQAGIDRLTGAIVDLEAGRPNPNPQDRDHLADIRIALKAAVWALKHGEFFEAKDVAATLDAIAFGLKRAEQLLKNEHPWTGRPGGSVRAYRSRVDGSDQPYAIYVPPDLPAEEKVRLTVVLHGRGATLNEVRFLKAHEGKAYPKDETGLVLHVFGRTNNAYRWAGEADVFEAIEAVKRNHFVDDRRIVLQGFSMGGAGAWHLGLHHPSTWCAVEAGAGFAETKEYAKLKNVGDLQAKLLHIYDAADYALNAVNVPMAGYGGEDDPQRRASELIRERLQALGVPMTTEGLVTRGKTLDFLRIVGAKAGHKVDPESARILKAFRDEHAARGLDPLPAQFRFVTYTLKYNVAAWVRVEAMEESYKQTLVEGVREGDGEAATINRIENVAVLGVDREAGRALRIGDQTLPLREAAGGFLPFAYYARRDDGWHALDYDESRRFQDNADRRKVHDLQGPIDDAFTGPFLCVRGTGQPWNPKVQAWADERLKQFAATWSQFLRGDLPVKDDNDVTPDDEERCHLILFGDPGSNRIWNRLETRLPFAWTREHLKLAGTSYPAADHAPVVIAPHPEHPLRYVAANAIHTFGPKEFAGTNALLYPRLGDFAVYQVERDQPLTNGLFDERWRSR